MRKPANAKPITSNPLFPAVVALWFGAAFGLGSLAVRPSLLENLVLQSHIDLIIPAAAPPLGITARILLALVLAAVGAMLGIILARRLSRPAPEIHERKRGARDLAAQTPRVRARDAHPDAPARRPISAHEELGGERSLEDERPAAIAPGMLANRRRALAILDHETSFVPQDMAPLPGMDVVQPLDLAALALHTGLDPEPLPVAAPPPEPVSTATVLNWANTAPIVLAADPAQILPELAQLDGRQVFGVTPPEAPATTERQIFGIVAEGDHLPQDFIRAAGFQTSVFDTPQPAPLFDRAVGMPDVAPTNAPSPELAPALVATPAELLPSPASLGMTELAARLAESMRRRRERAQMQASAPAATVITAASVFDLPAMPTVLAPPSEPAPAPAAYKAPTVEAPVPVPLLAQFTAAAPAAAEPIAPSPLGMPAAMRPLALDAFLVDDTPFDDASLLPPRHIAMPAPVSQPAAFAPPVAAAPAPAAEDAEQFGEDSLTDTADDNPYASLLAVAPTRQGFVRIDEPEADAGEAIEPVVIFPGQAARAAPFNAGLPAISDDNGLRRFDAPVLAGQGQGAAASNTAENVATAAAVKIDPAEAAQALRAALSNLQRMSAAS